MKLRERLKNFVMPRQVCVFGAAIFPVVGVGAFYLITLFLYNNMGPMGPIFEIAPRIETPEQREFERQVVGWVLVGIGVVIGGFIWIISSRQAYVHCHMFWHNEKPEWAKDDDDFEEDYDTNFHFCPICDDELGDDRLNEIDICEHQGCTP